MSVTNPTRLNQSSKQTVIEDDTEFKGKLSSKSPVVVKGLVDGDIEGPSLQISSTGTVTGKVKVGELRSEGTIGGLFDADTIHLAGTVQNKTVIRAKSLEVKLAPADGKLQVTFGDADIDVGEMPTKTDAAAGTKAKAKASTAKAAGAAETVETAGEKRPAKRDTQTPPTA